MALLHESWGGGEVDFEAAGEEGFFAAVALDHGALVGERLLVDGFGIADFS